MKRIRNAFVAAAVIGATALATLRSASAWGRPGPFFWGGLAAGAAAAAVVGNALAAPYYYGPYPYRRCPTWWNGYTWIRSCY